MPLKSYDSINLMDLITKELTGYIQEVLLPKIRDSQNPIIIELISKNSSTTLIELDRLETQIRQNLSRPNALFSDALNFVQGCSLRVCLSTEPFTEDLCNRSIQLLNDLKSRCGDFDVSETVKMLVNGVLK